MSKIKESLLGLSKWRAPELRNPKLYSLNLEAQLKSLKVPADRVQEVLGQVKKTLPGFPDWTNYPNKYISSIPFALIQNTRGDVLANSHPELWLGFWKEFEQFKTRQCIKTLRAYPQWVDYLSSVQTEAVHSAAHKLAADNPENTDPIIRWQKELKLFYADFPEVIATQWSDSKNWKEYSQSAVIKWVDGSKVHTNTLIELSQKLSYKGIHQSSYFSQNAEEFFSLISTDGRTPKYPTISAEILNNLLKPWIGNNKNAQSELLQKKIMHIWGDPRIKKGSWAGVSSEALKVITGWLTRETFKAFLDLVSNYQGSRATKDHQWIMRRRFWEGLLDDGYIDSAWVVLDRSMAYEPAVQKLNGSYAKFKGTPSGNIAALIIEIGPLRISEWSHVGKVRIWDTRENNNIPEMYSTTYTPAELRVASNDPYTYRNFEYTHSAGGSWMYKVKDAIRYLTDMDITVH